MSMPSGKVKILEGPRCMFRDQIKKVNLEMRDNKFITGTVILHYYRD